MNPWHVITVFVALEELYQQLGDPIRYRPHLVPAEIMTVAVIAAQYFNNNHERALIITQQMGYFGTHRLDVSRFNRQLHQLADFLDFALDQLKSGVLVRDPCSTACRSLFASGNALVGAARFADRFTVAILWRGGTTA